MYWTTRKASSGSERTTHKEGDGICTADSMFDDFLYWPENLENICYYEFVAKYDKENKNFKEMDKKKANAQKGMVDSKAVEGEDDNNSDVNPKTRGAK